METTYNGVPIGSVNAKIMAVTSGNEFFISCKIFFLWILAHNVSVINAVIIETAYISKAFIIYD